MNALHDRKGDCHCHPRPPAHAALTTRHECDNLMEDERENKAGTKEIANLLYRLGGDSIFL